MQAFASFPELSQAFANEKFAQPFADLSRLHVLLSRRHDTLTSLQIVTWEVLAAGPLGVSNIWLPQLSKPVRKELLTGAGLTSN